MLYSSPVMWPLVRQASNYCGLLIDGEDLLVVSRTSRHGRNQHDNDLAGRPVRLRFAMNDCKLYAFQFGDKA